MKKVVSVILLCLVSILFVHSQKTTSARQLLDEQFMEQVIKPIKEDQLLERLERFDTFAQTAKKNNEWEKAINGIYNGIALKIDILDRIRNFRKTMKVYAYRDQVYRLSNAIWYDWDEIIAIHDQKLKKETSILAEALAEIGKSNMEFKLSPLSSAQRRMAYKAGEKCLVRSIEINGRLFGQIDSKTLESQALLGNIYFSNGEYEAATKVYQQLLIGIDANKNSLKQITIDALVSYATIMEMIDSGEESKKVLQIVSDRTKQSETIPEKSYNLGVRTNDSLLDPQLRPNNNQISFPSSLSGSPNMSWINPSTTSRTAGNPAIPGMSGSRADYNTPTLLTGGFGSTIGASTSGNSTRSIGDGRSAIAKVNVVVDETGKVVEVLVVDVDNEKTREKIERLVRKLNFQPYVFEGVKRKMRGFINFKYLKKLEKTK